MVRLPLSDAQQEEALLVQIAVRQDVELAVILVEDNSAERRDVVEVVNVYFFLILQWQVDDISWRSCDENILLDVGAEVLGLSQKLLLEHVKRLHYRGHEIELENLIVSWEYQRVYGLALLLVLKVKGRRDLPELLNVKEVDPVDLLESLKAFALAKLEHENLFESLLVEDEVLANNDNQILFALVCLESDDLILFSGLWLVDVKLDGVPFDEGDRVIDHKLVDFSDHERLLSLELDAQGLVHVFINYGAEKVMGVLHPVDIEVLPVLLEGDTVAQS